MSSISNPSSPTVTSPNDSPVSSSAKRELSSPLEKKTSEASEVVMEGIRKEKTSYSMRRTPGPEQTSKKMKDFSIARLSKGCISSTPGSEETSKKMKDSPVRSS